MFNHGWNNFLLSASDNVIVIFSLSVILLLLYYIFLKRQIANIFDPFFFSVFSSAMATAVCVYMYIFDLFYKEELFLIFIVTELAYLIGLKVFKKNDCIDNKCYMDFKKTVVLENITYYIYGIIFITIQLISFATVGVPLLAAGSRLEFYGGGSGALLVVNNSIVFPLIMLALKKYFCHNLNCFDKIYMFILNVFIITFLLGTGAKSALIMIVYGVFFFRRYAFVNQLGGALQKKIDKFLKYTFSFAVFGSFFVTMVEFNTSEYKMLFISLIIRFLASGDIFAYYYSDNFYNNILLEDNILLAIFNPCIALIRLLSYSDFAPTIGLQIWQLVNNSLEVRGPNPRHNIFGFLYLGIYGAVIYSFIVGMLSSWVRCKVYYINQHNMLIYILTCYLYIMASSFNVDIALQVGTFFSFMLVNGALFFIAYIIYLALRRYDNAK